MRNHDDYDMCSMKRGCVEVNKPISSYHDCGDPAAVECLFGGVWGERKDGMAEKLL